MSRRIKYTNRQKVKTSQKAVFWVTAFTGVTAIVAFIVVFAPQAFRSEDSMAATTYTTLANGNWTNTTSVWSTNGSTPCGCYPGNSVTSIVNIQHNITLNTNISIGSGGQVNLQLGFSMSGSTRTITIANGGILNSHGSINAKEIYVNTSGTGNFYGPVTADSKFLVEGSVMFDTLVTVTNASLEFKSGSSITAGSGWSINMLNGNIYNEGTITLSSTCLKINNGSFDNKSGSKVQGTGYIETINGNIYNNGTWSSFVQWCASGSGSGLPVPENCNSPYCSMGGALPISLIEFDGKNENGIVKLFWVTTTEINNDFFTLMRSSDGKSFSIIAKIDGAGTSSNMLKYSYHDNPGMSGNYFYRLNQTDYDGTSVNLKTIKVVMKAKLPSKNISVYPNPFNEKFTVKFDSEYPTTAQFHLINMNGAVVFSETIAVDVGQNQFDFSESSELKPGNYLIKIISGNELLNQKQVIRY